MKKHILRLIICMISFCMTSTVFFPSIAEKADTDDNLRNFVYVMHREDGAAGNFIEYPEFVSDDPADEALLSAINRTIQETAHIPEYLQLLSTIQEGGTGLRLTWQSSNFVQFNEQGEQIGVRYVSLLFSAEGKMLRGRPGQIYYPLTLDLATGELVEFDALFTDPENAKLFIESYLYSEVEPTLSTYLENNRLFPVPYNRFFLDGSGNVILVYESEQLSFLSGFSGAVAFRYSELWEYLDTSPDGIPMQAMETLYGTLWNKTAQYIPQPEKWKYPQLLETFLDFSKLPGFPPLLIPDLGTPMEEVLEKLHAASDSGYYADGAYYEVEEPVLRGTYLLTDREETTLTGILTSRLDCYGIETGKTTLKEAITLMEAEPAALLQIDETAAEMYLVCPGTVALYTFTDLQGRAVQFFLYADDAGTVQYISMELA